MKKTKSKYLFVTLNIHVFFLIVTLLFSKLYYYIDKLSGEYFTFFSEYIYVEVIFLIAITFVINLIIVWKME